MRFYVDFDGTLADPVLDDRFKEVERRVGPSEALDKYKSINNISHLSLNMALLSQLALLKRAGHDLYLWTNRGQEQYPMTVKNLGQYKSLFKDMFFRDGQKIKDRPDGILFDNETKYKDCGKLVLVQFKPFKSKEVLCYV
jgi:hypothetical protein